MATSSVGFNYSIKNIPINKNFDVRVNCREEFNFLRYSSSFGGSSVGVSFLDSDPITVPQNILIQDLTELVEENSPRKLFESTFNSQVFTTSSSKFLITDVFKTLSNNELSPLYLRHDLSQFSDISNVQILDSNFDAVNADLYSYYDETATLGVPSRFIYTNLESSYNSVANEYELYYYRFINPINGEVVIGLLDTKPFYKQADFSSSPLERAYRAVPGEINTSVQIWFNSRNYSPTPLPLQQRFSIKSTGSDRITVLPPLDLPSRQRWYPRITRGQFHRDTGVPGERLFYYVPEYYNQFFSPIVPYKNAIEKEAKILDETLIHVAPGMIANLGITGFYVYIALKDDIGRTVRAFTNDPSASLYITKNKVITDIIYEKNMIQSIDSAHGFIKLSDKIDTSLKPFITYRYEEHDYTYNSLNINSTINPDILNTSLLFYVIPEGSTPNTRSVFHIQMDEGDNIISAPQSSSYKTYNGVTTSNSAANEIIDSNLISTDIYTGFELEILSGADAGRKIKIQSYNGTLKKVTLQVPLSASVLAGVKFRINKKSKSYSVFDSISATTFSYTGWIETYSASPYYYVSLANVYSIQTLSPKNIDSTDIRIRGGGIKAKKLEESLGLQDEVQWYWDVGYWDGQPYPGMGAIIVEIPRSVLQEVGGPFTRPQVEEIVYKHTAEGSYPIIRYYDRSTVITKLEPGNGHIKIYWQDVDAGSYQIYYGNNPNNLQLYKTVAGAITEYDITGLDNGRIYYFRIHAVYNGVEQLPSRIVFGKPFNAATVLPGATYGDTNYSEGTYQS